uniref:DUF4346 domain-containing protein n=1 Tax=Nemalion sp. H.1444 TaxID=1907586 RepID=A0A1G4NW94_9FLOR|nr:Hypothetical protein ORF_1 [Nemalion sp. H.1444]
MSKNLPEIPRTFLDNFHSRNGTISTIVEDPIYCTVYTKLSNQIAIEFYVQKLHTLGAPLSANRPLVLFQAHSANKIYELIKSHTTICNQLSSQHGLYIGMELIKAEIALLTAQLYCQS